MKGENGEMHNSECRMHNGEGGEGDFQRRGAEARREGCGREVFQRGENGGTETRGRRGSDFGVGRGEFSHKEHKGHKEGERESGRDGGSEGGMKEGKQGSNDWKNGETGFQSLENDDGTRVRAGE